MVISSRDPFFRESFKLIILMGGSGKRFGSTTPKQFFNLSGKKIYLRTLEVFLPFGEFEKIFLVCHKDYIDQVREEISDNRICVIEGGKTRQASSYRGLLACGSKTTYVMIHDAVRPFISSRIIRDNLDALKKYYAVNTCIPSSDTIVHAKAFDTIESIPSRTKYLRGQTPQSFHYPLIVEAHEKTTHHNISDDCRLIIDLKKPVHIVQGSENNIKITNEIDLFLAEKLMHRKGKTFSQQGSLSLQGKTFAITGGTGGIGSALTKLLKREKAHPMVLSRSSPFYPVDLTDYHATEILFKKLGAIDGLINCVGYLAVKPFHKLTSREIDHLIQTNLHSLIYSCHVADIKAGGHIINLSSSSFSRGRKFYALYSSTKAAIVNFTQGLAEERPDLHINAIIPQRTATPMRMANFPDEAPSTLLSPAEVAQEILSLLKQIGTTSSLFEVRKK